MSRQSAISVLMLLLSACAAAPTESRRGKEGPAGEGDPEAGGGAAQACLPGNPHPGFAGQDTVADRLEGTAGLDRRRVKPYSALRTELWRVLGQVPESLPRSAAAFGLDQPRWQIEPTAGAVSVYTTYSVAFEACYAAHVDAKYETAPTEDSVREECASLQHRAWQRKPTNAEITACTDLLLTGVANEASPRRRWAHGCASVLSSAGFTSY